MIGKIIEGLLEELGMSQRELAKKVGITEVSMSRYINENRTPHTEILFKIADALGVSVDYLRGRDFELKGLKEISANKENKSPTLKSSPSLIPEIWNDLTNEERKEAENFMRWQKSKRGVKDENAASGQ